MECELIARARKDLESLGMECSACRELAEIRATILVNFGVGAAANDYGIEIEDQGTTISMVFAVIRRLVSMSTRTEHQGIWRGDVVELKNGTLTTCRGFVGCLMAHTGGFCDVNQIKGVAGS